MKKQLLKNKKYWERRALERELSNYKNTEEFVKYIDTLFSRAQSNIERSIIYRLERLAKNNDLTITEVRRRLNAGDLMDFKMSIRDYIQKGRGVLDEKTIKELDNASQLFHISQLQAMEAEIKAEVKLAYAKYEKAIGKKLEQAYADSYYRNAYDLQKLTGYHHISRIDDKKFDVILKKPWSPDQVAFDKRIWGASEVVTNILHKELGTGIALGENPTTIAKRLTDKIAVSKRAAYRIAYTESAYFSEQGTYDSYKSHGVKEYQILATLDNRTSQICREMDGKHFELKHKVVGVNYPPFHPHCRTTTIPYFEGLGGVRAARDPSTGKTVRVEGNLNFKEWRQQYVA